MNLSIVIPTYNRVGSLIPLVENLLEITGKFEVCIHDDGSEDCTYKSLCAITDQRLKISCGENQGRAMALKNAIKLARGKYVMIYDDDDKILVHGLNIILNDCESEIPEKCAGFVYHMLDKNGDQIGKDFPVRRSNFLALRADYKITGDKKEVVLRSLLLPAMDIPGKHRRVPTSLYWSRIAKEYDVVCRNFPVGIKIYEQNGMSSRIHFLKSRNPVPMIYLNKERTGAFFTGRYRSAKFLARCLGSLIYYNLIRFWY